MLLPTYQLILHVTFGLVLELSESRWVTIGRAFDTLHPAH